MDDVISIHVTDVGEKMGEGSVVFNLSLLFGITAIKRFTKRQIEILILSIIIIVIKEYLHKGFSPNLETPVMAAKLSM